MAHHPIQVHENRVRIGTSGWSYSDWRGGLYPAGLPSGQQLHTYANRFTTVEVNATFYGPLRPATIAGWAAKLPTGFLMAAKAPKAITHQSRLRDTTLKLTDFLESLRPLGAFLGPLLFQLPPSLSVDLALLRSFLTDLGEVLPKTGHHAVIEFRHPSWYTAAVEEMLAAAAMTWCVHDMPGSVAPRVNPLTSKGCLYIRKHGVTGKYRGTYPESSMREDADYLRQWTNLRRPVFVYFNNSIGGCAWQDALRLRHIIKESE